MENKLIEKIECELCDKVYKAKANYFYHLKTVHNYTIEEIDIIRERLKHTTTASEDLANKTRVSNCLKKHGCENISSLKTTRDSVKHTNLKRYGTTSPLANSQVKDKIKQTNLKHYGVEYASQSQEIKDKIKQTNLKHYGVKYASQSQEIKDKIKQTTLERYGVEHVFQLESVKEKTKQTCIERFGVEHPLQSQEVQDKLKKTNLEKYGCEYGLSNEDVKQKGIDTCQQKYGVDRYVQTLEYYEKAKQTQFEKYDGKWFPQTDAHFKANYKWKDYKFPSGKIIKIQGYEGLAIDYFLARGVDESDFIIDSKQIVECIGELWYTGIDNAQHRYFPDIYITSTKQLIEVKSKYTYYKDKIINELKKQCAIAAGLNFQFMVIEPKTQEYKFC